ncbi:O-methyltransferase family 2 [Penicillium nucicola]|uniref:O-methyltransferase family 2 n=1 Tax=Penicillium nucicola TaxID=1850975 RepID=UPI002544FBC8|nr:O-methyltransferase family 2 [Penicillium nucicola]KAJ5775356.1 O-methyltransferase family 2 [Penicillium nucicola]
MSQELDIAGQINALTGAVKSEKLNEATRLQALDAARALIETLESPVERIIHDVVMSPPILASIRMGVQLGIFSQISQNPGHGATAQEIAEQSGASPIVVDQFLRLLAATGYVDQQDTQIFKPSVKTMIMADPNMEATIRACFDIGNCCTSKAPEFFRRNQNQFPSSAKDTPFQLGMNTDLGYFEWLGQNPALAKDFQQWMSLKQAATASWVDWFDIEKNIIDDFDAQSPDNVLLVDVGGGEGRYLREFQDKFQIAPGQLVLQDLPNVIEAIENPPDVKLIAHDFFTPQPVKGARAYFMHWILHDWSDERCRAILTNIVAAMKPGFSKLILHESILPDKGCDLSTACISVMMMVQVAAFERSEAQWRDLLESVGLSHITFHQSPGVGEGIIEAMRV